MSNRMFGVGHVLAQWESEYSADSREHEEAIVRDNRARLFVDKLVQRIQKLMRRSMVFRMKGLEKMVSIKPLRDSIRLTSISRIEFVDANATRLPN